MARGSFALGSALLWLCIASPASALLILEVDSGAKTLRFLDQSDPSSLDGGLVRWESLAWNGGGSLLNPANGSATFDGANNSHTPFFGAASSPSMRPTRRSRYSSSSAWAAWAR